ncbi:hypothetical protein [Streptomyces chromofuscus]|uniref:Uncharacterized protein n=1 Tax=Streptomyces chromofuscus TaxID=42881 RepID=A0A7M2T519_STRCW|nr:hypothetical protein [Streptomyces chromofuscus]QOV42993.1 hypothetical protein IPT68_24865 [Streptomyces chromofuscus]GGS92803.1 hypothetical protein GCM10010254_10920 [Streptomyces chromofuscus]
MHHHESDSDPGRLASFADVLAGELPGTWSSTYHPPEHKDDLAELADRVWDMDLVAESLAQHPLRHAAVLTREDGAQLVVLDRHDERDGFLIAAVAPRDIPREAFRGMREPDGIALSDDPFLSSESVAGDLLARYDAALAQVRHNSTDLSHEPDSTRPSQLERVVLTWQADGSLAAAPTADTAAAVLLANGFVHDEQTGTYRLSGDDTAAQARAVRQAGVQLAAQGITTALQHPAARPAPTATTPTAPPPQARTSNARSR